MGSNTFLLKKTTIGTRESPWLRFLWTPKRVLTKIFYRKEVTKTFITQKSKDDKFGNFPSLLCCTWVPSPPPRWIWSPRDIWSGRLLVSYLLVESKESASSCNRIRSFSEFGVWTWRQDKVPCNRCNNAHSAAPLSLSSPIHHCWQSFWFLPLETLVSGPVSIRQRSMNQFLTCSSTFKIKECIKLKVYNISIFGGLAEEYKRRIYSVLSRFSHCRC